HISTFSILLLRRPPRSTLFPTRRSSDLLTAISPTNYKFSYKGTREVEGRLLHVYQLKPRKKRVSLFKGHIYLDAYSGSLVRAEGDRKSTRLNSSHRTISYAVFCLKKKKK